MSHKIIQHSKQAIINSCWQTSPPFEFSWSVFDNFTRRNNGR